MLSSLYKRGRFGTNQEVIVFDDCKRQLIVKIKNSSFGPIFGQPEDGIIRIDPRGIAKTKEKGGKYYVYIILPGTKDYQRFIFTSVSKKERFMELFRRHINANGLKLPHKTY